MNRIATFVFLALTTTASAQAQVKLPYEKIQLGNGLKVFLMPQPGAGQVAIVTWYDVGSRDEVKGKTGFAHLFEHLMFKGSPHVADGVLDKQIEEAGGWTNAFTDNDMTVYLDVSSPGFLERAIYMEADRIAGLAEAIDQPKLDNQREVVLNERRQSYENRPYGVAWLRLPEALFPEGHPYHHPVIGYVDDIRSVKVEDAQAFFRMYYAPNNAVMVIAGEFDPKVARAMVQKYLGWLPTAKVITRPKITALADLDKDIVLTETDDVQASRVYVAWRAPALFTPDEPALHLAASVLADGKSSRLYKKLVVDQRVAQDVDASFAPMVHGGLFLITATVKPGVKPEDVRATIEAEVAALMKDAPTQAEVDRVRNVREANFLKSLEGTMDRAQTLAHYTVQAKDPDYLAKDLARFRAVTPKTLQAAAAKVFGKKRVILTINPGPSKAQP
jgi:zinc protease